jgi:hypothetical protein
MEKKKKFNQVWSNQTNLGKRYGLSAIAVGKILTTKGLRDPTTKQPTDDALIRGYAKATPLKDGTPYFMWNVAKVRPLIEQSNQSVNKEQKSNNVEWWVKKVIKNIDEAERVYQDDSNPANDKLGRLMYDMAYDGVPKKILAAVESQVNEILESRA